MTRTTNDKPTDAELQILRILWSRGPSTVRDVHEILGKMRKVGYTGSLKLMQNMADKGLVTRNENQRSHIYAAAIREEPTQRRLVKELLFSAFSGSADKLVMQALAVKKVTIDELTEIRRMIDTLEEQKRK
jgi:BlaI family transcriptional regulator, penicillinase repressor